MTIALSIARPWSANTRLGAASAFALLFAGCTEPAPSAPPPPEVRVITVEPHPLARITEVPGRLQAVRSSEVRARVDGIVQRRLYNEGTDVRAGQALFRIDPRELQAQLNAAEAALARAEATAANADQDVKRYEGLVGQQAISQQEYDAAVARSRTARADVAQNRAQVETARLNLSYATVTAPIAGRAGRAAVTEGALVNRVSGTLLTRIEQLDPIFVNFSQSSSDLLALRQTMASHDANKRALERVAVRLVLEDGTVYGTVGHLNFLDLSIDEATGTTAFRAEFPNPDRLLLPGQFVRVRIETGAQSEGILVPQRAVTIGPQGASVMVVAANNVAEARPVKVGELQGGSWEVISGLTAGERIIVDGLQKVQPGAAVRVAMDTAQATKPAVVSPSEARESR